MTLEMTRLDRAFAILDALDQAGSESDGLWAALEALSGIELTGAPDAVRDAIESLGLKHNAIMERYPTAAAGTSPELHDEDAHELVTCLRQLAELVRDAETERILARLRHHGRVLPEAEVIEARRHRDWFVPHFIRECYEQIEKRTKLENCADHLPRDQHSSVPFFSLFLFSEWHVADSVPVILKGLSLPGEGPFDLFGDAVHDQVPGYLAQFLADDLDQIDELIRDAGANDYARWSAVNSYQYLVRDQKISVADAVARLDRLFHDTKTVDDDGDPDDGHCYELSAGILDAIHTIGGASQSTITADEQNWNFVDESIMPREVFDKSSESGEDAKATDRLRRLRPTHLEDCLDCLRPWAAFQPKHKPVQLPPALRLSERPTPAILQPSARSDQPLAAMPKPRAGRVPRNAQCPCGSGKKYKQCCMRSAS